MVVADAVVVSAVVAGCGAASAALGSALGTVVLFGSASDEVATSRTSPQAAATTTDAAPPQSSAPLLVSRVIDGDTIDLDNGDRVRLVQIDAPESGEECYAAKSGRLLRQLLPVGSEVRLEADRRLDKVDRYGRLLRYVFVSGTSTSSSS